MKSAISGGLRHHVRTTAISAIALGLGIALLPGAAAAQAPVAEAAPSGLDEIVVTARKVAENLQDVPVSITAYTGEALQQQGAVRTQDVARMTPSLFMREAPGSSSQLVISLRGQVQTNTLASLDPSVGMYVDGVYWARAYGLNGDLLDLQNVQVLKGPQGTLFGRNTTGGAILFQTNDPSLDGFSARLAGTYGRFDERKIEGFVNIPIVSDKLALRVAGQRQKRDGFVHDYLNGRKYNDKDGWAARAKLLWQTTDNLSVLISGDYFKSDANSPARRMSYFIPFGLTPPAMSADVRAAAIAAGFPTTYPAIGAQGAQFAGNANLAAYLAAIADDPLAVGNNNMVNPAGPAANGYPHSYVKTRTLTGTINLDTSFGAVKAIGGYRRVNTLAQSNVEGAPQPIHDSFNQQTLAQYSAEVQATGKAFDDALDFAAGVFYFHEYGFDAAQSTTVPTINAVTSIFYSDLDGDSLGAYAQGTWHFTDKLSFTGGLRYSIDDKGFSNHNTTLNRTTGVVACAIGGLTVAAGNCLFERHSQFDGWSYTAGLEYKVTDDILLYAKTSRGFRSGGQNIRAAQTFAAVPFRPEIAISQEAGIKSEWFDRRLRLNLAGYYTRITDLQRTTIVGFGSGLQSTILSNAGKARFWGLEAELTAQVFEGFQLSANGSITRPKYLSYAEAPSRTNLDGDRSAETFDSVPREQFSISGNYSRALSDDVNLKLRADYSWTSAMYLFGYAAFLGDPAAVTINPATGKTIAQEILDSIHIPAVGLLSARVGVSFMDDRYEVALWGKNLTNVHTPDALLFLSGIGYTAFNPREPVTYGVTATVKFGH